MGGLLFLIVEVARCAAGGWSGVQFAELLDVVDNLQTTEVEIDNFEEVAANDAAVLGIEKRVEAPMPFDWPAELSGMCFGLWAMELACDAGDCWRGDVGDCSPVEVVAAVVVGVLEGACCILPMERLRMIAVADWEDEALGCLPLAKHSERRVQWHWHWMAKQHRGSSVDW